MDLGFLVSNDILETFLMERYREISSSIKNRIDFFQHILTWFPTSKGFSRKFHNLVEIRQYHLDYI